MSQKIEKLIDGYKIADAGLEDIRYYDFNYLFHREDGPAIEYIGGSYKGHKLWMIHGKYHRVDGPAIEFYNGEKQYWIDDKQYTFKEWQEIIKFKAFL